MKKITIVALHLGYGGIEKAIASLSNMLCDKYVVEIISTYKLFDKPAFSIDDRVKIKYLMDDKPNREEIKKAIKKINIISTVKEFFKAFRILYLKRN
jgi:N-acetylglucosaminyldiphosphoundecaprenol N-acetyl-beta-D-mannosaminyltransferase